MPDYIPGSQLAASQWLSNFGYAVTTFYTNYFITETVANQINGAAEQFALAIKAEELARIAYENAVNEKNVARANSEKLARTYSQIFRADNRVTSNYLIEAGLPPRGQAPAPSVLNPASDLVATVDAQTATVILSWKPNGSSAGTSYEVQQKVGSAGTWSTVMATSKRRLKLTGVPAGVPRFYRVIAQRGGAQAGASNVTVIYQSGTNLLLAA